eukprot:CAMPEP_0118994016 /NCGR_PEP_ID=MMETSP1173-20130426/56098_1 /TAXON_ID=1034831 /ORGANISM="Rhizochromulina marina cf, Strain CCMP1243" /LENGTH=48 /DNA_ID= /DNA_START= /DNA_END= /DNA_ORIENTATION=
MTASALFLGSVYSRSQYLGAAVIMGGAILVILPAFLSTDPSVQEGANQ